MGSSSGKVLEVEVDMEGYGWACFLRAKVEVNVTKPLPICRFFKFSNKQN